MLQVTPHRTNSLPPQGRCGMRLATVSLGWVCLTICWSWAGGFFSVSSCWPGCFTVAVMLLDPGSPMQG